MWRFRGHWAVFLGGAGLAAALASCDPPPAPAFNPPFVGTVYRSQFFEYHARDATPLCSTLLSLMDRHAELIGAKVGFAPGPSDPLIPYYQFDGTNDLAASGVCQGGAAGCTTLSAVYSSLPFHAHEMAHAYTFRAWRNDTVGLLAEGEAVALSCEPALWGPSVYWPLSDVPSLADWRPLLHLNGNNLSTVEAPQEEYVAAGAFVTWLASHFGWPAVGRLHQSLWVDATADDFEQAFGGIFSMSADDAWAAARAAPSSPACQPDWQCAGPRLSVGQSAAVDCDLQMHGTIRAGGSGPVGLLVFAPIVSVLSCATPGSQYVLDSSREGSTLHWARIPLETYAFSAADAVTSQTVVPLLESPASAVLGDSCATAPTFPLSSAFAGESVVDLPPVSPAPIDGWIHLTGGDAMHTLDAYAFTGGSITICSGCGEGALCSALPPATRGHQLTAIGDNAYVHLEGVTTKNDPFGPSALDYFPTLAF